MPDDGGDSEGYASVDSSLGLPSYDLHSVHSDPVRRNLKPHRQHFASFKLTERLTVPGEDIALTDVATCERSESE